MLGLGVFFLTAVQHRAPAAARASRPRTRCSARSSASAAGEARAGGGDRARGDRCATLAIARPLLFASVAPDVAGARGVPTRLLGVGFLALLGVVAAEATQAVGALLLLGLLAAPAAAAHRLAGRPFAGIALAGLLAVGGDVGRPGARLRGAVAAAEHRDRDDRGGHLLRL